MVEWSIPAGTVALIGVQTIGFAVGVAKASLSIQRAIDKKFTEHDLSFASVRSEFYKGQADHKAQFLESLNKCGGDIRDLAHRVQTLEAGQDEWTKSLRRRTHELANQLNDVVLKVDRLERPRTDGVK